MDLETENTNQYYDCLVSQFNEILSIYITLPALLLSSFLLHHTQIFFVWTSFEININSNQHQDMNIYSLEEHIAKKELTPAYNYYGKKAKTKTSNKNITTNFLLQ